MKTPTRICIVALAFAMSSPLATHAQTAGSLDLPFNASINGRVYTTAMQPDGKIVIGGTFNSVGGQPRNRIARLNADGILESAATFNAGSGPNGSVNCVAVQADGKIVLGGDFTSVNGQPRNYIARLNPDGSVESTASFNPGTGAGGAFNAVRSVAMQADGKILLAGHFTSVNGQPRNRIARLNADGTVESTATFDLGTGANNTVLSVAVQADGKILLGGSFTSVNDQPRNDIARLNPDGSVESTATFNPGTGPNNFTTVFCVALQGDGKILLAGSFSSVNGQTRRKIARLNTDGSVESTATFNAGTGASGGSYGGLIYGLAVQADGKILLGGDFTTVNGQPRTFIARLNANGTVESTATFNTGTGPSGTDEDNRVSSLALQESGKILVGGFFSSFNGQSRNGFVRLANDPATQTLTIPGSTRVQWARGGAAPEVEQVTFELSTDGGASWSPLGSGTRIAGGWERTGLSLPATGSIRARGRTSGGNLNGSSGLVEQIATFSFPQTHLEAWRLSYFGSTANSGPGADENDDDRDGSVNVLEFATHRDPTLAGGAIGALSKNGTVLEFRYQRAKAAVLDGFSFAVEWSDMLVPLPWSTVEVSESILSDDGTVQEILATIPAGGTDQRFVRLRVNTP